MLNIKKLNLFAGILVVLVMGWQAGWRDAGFDRQGYIDIYNNVISSDDIKVALFFAKDILNFTIIIFSNYFNEDPRLAFFITCTLSFYLKYCAIIKFAPNYAFIFLFLYSLFIAPGLEFAAMRSGLAVAFIILAAVNLEKKINFYLFLILACMAHASMLAVVIFLIPVNNYLIGRNKILLFIIAAVVAIYAEAAVLLFQHGAAYENNSGTVNALLVPVATLIISILIFVDFKNKLINDQKKLDENFRYIAIIVYCLIAMSFGLTFTIVTASTRYLEVAWCLILMAAVVRWRKNLYSFFGLLLLLIFLSFVNIGRSTWLAILNPDFIT